MNDPPSAPGETGSAARFASGEARAADDSEPASIGRDFSVGGSEARIKGLLELSLDAIIVRDRDGAITFWNYGAEATYGWKAAEALGRNSHALLEGPLSSGGKDIDVILRTDDRWQGEITHTCRDGRQIVVESRQVVQRDARGEVLAILEIDRDVTEKRRLIDQLAAADKAKDSFLATLGHELRNPLTPLRHGMEVLGMVDADTPEAIEVRETIERNIRRMTRLIDDLLDVSRITHGYIELRKENVDLITLVREVVSELRSMADAANDKVTMELPQGPLIIDADPVRLTQIAENVLHNAIKFTENGTIDLALGTEDGNAVLKVRDSGVGIAKEDLNRIWEPFMQADTSLERKRGGLGLGLTLVRSLVELHGGTIAGSSEGSDRGSEFVVRMPLANRASEAQMAPKSAHGALKGRRVLIVDDNHDAVASFATLLKLMDNEVRTATSGPEALSLAREYRPEIVLLDIGLPGMNGYEVARALKADGSAQPILIAVSGYGSPEDRARSAEAGFDAHFVKPMEIGALEAFLDSHRRN
jgi:two-component system CheB/CheR fusion protein